MSGKHLPSGEARSKNKKKRKEEAQLEGECFGVSYMLIHLVGNCA
jgi:hypothetical protein